jgi:hypothetical protein
MFKIDILQFFFSAGEGGFENVIYNFEHENLS